MYLECQRSDYAKEFQRGHWSFLEPGDEETLYRTCNFKPEGKWDQPANQMIDVCAQSGHPVFARISALSRGTLKRKQGRKCTSQQAQKSRRLIMRTIQSTNQLGIYGVVSSWCVDFSRCARVPIDASHQTDPSPPNTACCKHPENLIHPRTTSRSRTVSCVTCQVHVLDFFLFFFLFAAV